MRRLLLLPLLALLLPGCPRRLDFGTYGRLDDPFYVLQVIQNRYQQVGGLVGEGKLAVDSKEVSGTLRMAVEVNEPAFIYLETVDVLGTPRGTFATAGERFAFYQPGENVFYTGPATAEQLGRFLPVSLPPEDLAAAMLGELPLLFDAEEARMEVDETAGTYVILLRRGVVRQRLEVATRDLRLIAVETRGMQAIDGSFDDFEELLPGLIFPTTVVLETPRAEVRLRYTDIRLNPEVVPANFELQPPPGARVEAL
ncbi:DUF4292 domain-containing protein [Vulgatibacter sp.]|uniref:DUF4292 domain-containing protein n=1 Tax=Vulgatibacter sp. TaxID=1971226 RepID=UPI00356907E1